MRKTRYDGRVLAVSFSLVGSLPIVRERTIVLTGGGNTVADAVCLIRPMPRVSEVAVYAFFRDFVIHTGSSPGRSQQAQRSNRPRSRATGPRRCLCIRRGGGGARENHVGLADSIVARAVPAKFRFS